MVETNPDYERIYGDIPKDWVPKDGVESICPAGPRCYEDAGNMTETLVALRGFFPDEAMVDTILKVTAGVLHLGNMEFKGEIDSFDGYVDTGKSAAGLTNCAELWGVSAPVVWSGSVDLNSCVGAG